ncbi:MAG: DUF4209 domain-containing protein [Phycisphaerales bacterium]|nr:DUF4209 domain-containing protein [Phycisphaerales bacterium]
MAILPPELEALMKSIEERSDLLTEYDISNKIRAALPTNPDSIHNYSTAMLAERMAFDFGSDKKDDEGQWGTYFGWSTTLPEGVKTYEWPSLQLVTPDVLDYWQARADEAQHPILRARYADLVWDFSVIIRKKSANIRCAQIAIDSYIELISRKLYRHRWQAKVKAGRALRLAISTKDQDRISRVRNTIIAFDKVESVEGISPGIAFDLLVDKTSSNLPEDQKERLLSQQEDALDYWVGQIKSATKDFSGTLALDPVTIRLARYYRKRQVNDKLQSALKRYAEAMMGASKQVTAILGCNWLRKACVILIEYGCRDLADRLAVELQRLDMQSMKQMKEFSVPITISREELEAYTEKMLAGTATDAIKRVTCACIPRRKGTDEQVRKLAELYPVPYQLMGFTLVDEAGRAVANIGTVEEDAEGRVITQTAQNLLVLNPMLHHLFRELSSRHKVGAEAVCGMILQSPAFAEDRHPVIRRGINACFDGDHEIAAHLLIPQIEQALRVIVTTSGGTTYKPSREPGTFQLRTLDDLLRDSSVIKVLTGDVALYFRVVLTDQRGWNLRNNLLHGVISPSQLGHGSTDRILHLILLLGSLRAKPKIGTQKACDSSCQMPAMVEMQGNTPAGSG